jgi:hypothetical protein
VIANTGEVANTTAADQHHGVFLKVVALTTDVCRDLLSIGKANSGYLTQSRVRLLRRLGFHLEADASTLGAAVENGRFRPLGLILASLTD